MTRLTLKRFSGFLKVTFDRSRNYFATLQTIMILYLFLDKTGFKMWYLLIIPFGILVMYLDARYIIGAERDYIWTRNGRVKRMLEDIEEIKDTLKKR